MQSSLKGAVLNGLKCLNSKTRGSYKVALTNAELSTAGHGDHLHLLRFARNLSYLIKPCVHFRLPGFLPPE